MDNIAEDDAYNEFSATEKTFSLVLIKHFGSWSSCVKVFLRDIVIEPSNVPNFLYNFSLIVVLYNHNLVEKSRSVFLKMIAILDYKKYE